MDVVNSLTHIADPGNHSVIAAPGVSVGQLDSWLENPAGADDTSLANLVSGPALQSLEDEVLHPSQRLNLLLVREAISLRLGGSAAGTGVYSRALRAFAAGVPEKPDLPELCRDRLPVVRTAFEKWWDATAARLAGLLHDWPNLRRFDHKGWTDLLAQRLAEDGLFVGLVRAKGRQWTLCTVERKFVVFPVFADWFYDFGGRILSAYFDNPRPAMEFSETDMQNWVRVEQWARNYNLGAPIPVELPRPEDAMPDHISPDYLPFLADWWQTIDRYWNRRNETRAYAEDLFGWTRPAGSAPFADWISSTKSYWD